MRADVEVLVIGAGHAGLSVAWQLRRLGRALLLVDANPRVGDAWRMRWDSLVLFTPRELNALPGLRFPRGPTPFPGKDDARRPTTLATGTPLRRAPARFFDPRWWRIAYLRGLIIGDRDLPKFVPWPLRRSSFTKVDLSRAANEHGLRFAARAVSAARNTICFADGTAVTARAVIWATGFAVDHSWIDAPRRDGIIAISRHRRGSLPGLWFVHARFLFPINHQAYGVAHDVARWLRRT